MRIQKTVVDNKHTKARTRLECAAMNRDESPEERQTNPVSIRKSKQTIEHSCVCPCVFRMMWLLSIRPCIGRISNTSNTCRTSSNTLSISRCFSFASAQFLESRCVVHGLVAVSLHQAHAHHINAHIAHFNSSPLLSLHRPYLALSSIESLTAADTALKLLQTYVHNNRTTVSDARNR